MTDATTFDIPRDQVPAALREKELMLDLEMCSVFSITIALQEHEKAEGHRFDMWPAEPRRIAEAQVKAWIERNPTAQVKAITTGVENRCCVLALHWRIK